MVAEYRTRRAFRARAATITTTGAVPASSKLMTATCALPPKITGPASQPANVGIDARAALAPMTSPKGTMPTSHGAMARAPVSPSRHHVLVSMHGPSGVEKGLGSGQMVDIGSPGRDLYRDRHGAGDDVEHGRAGARLLDQLAQLLDGCVAIHLEGDPDATEAVAHVGIEPQHAVEVDVALD